MLVGMLSVSEAVNAPQPEILAVFSSPNDQILTNKDDSPDFASTTLYLYKDLTHSQYGHRDGISKPLRHRKF